MKKLENLYHLLCFDAGVLNEAIKNGLHNNPKDDTFKDIVKAYRQSKGYYLECFNSLYGEVDKNIPANQL